MVERIDYSQLGPNGFRDLCHEVLRSLLGPLYTPFGAGGSDGGRDGVFRGTSPQFSESPIYLVAQFRFHDVGALGIRDARRAFLGGVKKELGAWRSRLEKGAQPPEVLIFVTNIIASGVPDTGTWDAFARLTRESDLPIRQILLWDGVKLEHEQAVRLRIQSLPSAQPVSETVLFEADCQYTEDHDSVVVAADIGNETGERLTVHSVELHLEHFGALTPANHRNTLDLPGAVFLGPGPSRPIEPGELIRVWWLFRSRDKAMKERMLTATPLKAELRVDCFPKRTLNQAMDLYSIRRLREMGGSDPL